ncbi:dihydrolipoyl dehydrogenase [Methylobacter tundripaludum]|uniref:Dihydrolipoyl dehydrogenase n=1 Tax=Methylobacter tundripaludum (strain ATCC BAA-1195 / DSM 17260 / SV96) TaxID=697282 RepID=G3IRY9_METTV|nr:dihydrolipoyl dehydrogenase [Methylobacter tundripaludum]EGW22200.1 dihydrolipoamide dehydrogenase [Methylobacter tundripaludum SV96]
MSKKQVKSFDVIVIGAGPAGYSSAIRCAQLGLKTACIDNWHDEEGQSSLGGTYLNAGCVASIALLESAKIYQSINHNLKEHGIQAEAVSVDIALMMQRKNNIIDALSRQIADSFAHYKIDCIQAEAKLLNERRVEITPTDHSAVSIIEAKHIVLATGSSPVDLSCAPIDNEFIIDTAMALNLDAVPKRLAIIGAGIIGLELAGIWNRLGAETILLEAQESFLGLADQQIAREAYRIYTEQGLELRLGARVISAKKGSKKVTVEYQDSEGTHALRVDKLIVASGRKPNTENLAAAEANLLLDENGYVHVDENCRTTLPGVYAIGDLTLLGPMIAHKGIEEGLFVAEQIAGLHNPVNYDLLPSVVFTDPEIAWVGQTEQALRAMGEPIKIGTFPLKATARAQAMGQTEGMVKIIAHAETDALLGIHIIGTQASEMIAEAVLAMEFSASSEDLARTIHAHPTLAKALHGAALTLKNKK